MLLAMPLETPNDELETLSDREFLEQLARQVTALTGSVAQLYGFTEGARDVTQKQLDHIDCMLHEVTQFLDEHKPALNRALGFLDAGRSMRAYLGARPKAGKT